MDSHGGNDRLCLYKLNSEDRGRIQGTVFICQDLYRLMGDIPDELLTIVKTQTVHLKNLYGETPRPLNLIIVRVSIIRYVWQL